MTLKHGAGRGHYNQSNPQSTKSADCKVATCKDESFSSNAIGNGDVTEVMGGNLDMVEGFISDMLPESSYLEAPAVVEDSNETTDRNEMRELKLTAVDEKNNNSEERTNTILVK